MRGKFVLWIAITSQLMAFFYISLVSPEAKGFIEVGIGRLREACSSQSPTPAGTEGQTRTLSTAGDFFFSGGELQSRLFGVAIIAMMLTILLLGWLLFLNRAGS